MLDDVRPSTQFLLDEVLMGLSGQQKTLPAKLFYDAEGCRLFGEITNLPEYYVTRVERTLLAAIEPQLPSLPNGALVEYGGSEESKALMLLDRIGASTYVPIDIAEIALNEMARRLNVARPNLAVLPVAADFLQPFSLPVSTTSQPKFGFFPGSTIGNLDPSAATAFLRQARHTLGAGAKFLVGVDLRKDPARLIPAYDDAQGITAAFNRNLLVHLNRIIGAAFDPLSFEHRAIWNPQHSRIEMHLQSLFAQTVKIAGRDIHFARGETIHTENSYKHTIESFLSIAHPAGWLSEAVWMDEEELFSIHLLAAKGLDE